MNLKSKPIVKLTTLVMLLLPLQGQSCTHLTPPALIPITAAIEAVPCRDLTELSYSAPKFIGEPDPNNEIDTWETIVPLRTQNAKIKAVCSKE